MADVSFSMAVDDDLPLTVRRERDARAREARERQAGAVLARIEREEGDGLSAPAATVTAFDIPFPRLAWFMLKAVFAAIPALLALTVVLWLIGQALQSAFPQLVKMKVDIQIYSPQSAADFRGSRPR